MWKGKGFSKAAGQCNGLQDYGFCDLKDCKAATGYCHYTDRRSSTSLGLISELRARGGAPDSEDDVCATSHFERRILRYLHQPRDLQIQQRKINLEINAVLQLRCCASRPPPRRKFQRYSYSGGPGVSLSRSKMSCLPDLPCRCPQ
ncbi:uncharacterized protein [Temnothorax longispinosus]|uniref:uncharacterized protein n=1 Tax=Temnothorax longispinosus TaxID=300112 RepID=UPI003A9A31B2